VSTTEPANSLDLERVLSYATSVHERWRRVAGRGVALLVLLDAVATVACVGSDPDAPPADPSTTPEAGTSTDPGTEGAACFPNGTCLGTLACRSGRCVDLGGPSSTPPEPSEAGDGGSDASDGSGGGVVDAGTGGSDAAGD
jgi:hypothetical protein